MDAQPNKVPGNGTPERGGRIAYIVSAFPALPETFVLFDMIEMEKLGMRVELYPLRRLHSKVKHPEAEVWIKRAHYRPFLSFAVLQSQWRFIRRDAVGYFRLLAEVLRSTWGSADFFFGAIAIFPKAVLFAEEMVEKTVQHIHAHFASHAATAAFIIHRLTGIPFSFTARGTDVQVDRHMLREKTEAAEFAIAVSKDNKKIIVEECGEDISRKVLVIHGGVDVDRLRPTHNSRAGAFRILCIARFEEVKGHAFLVEACRLLRDRHVQFECSLIGDGPLRSTIEKQVRRAKLQQHILLLGELGYPAVLEELRQADVVVLPTAPTANGKREGIPNVLKEAMACGLPVVASFSGGIPELVDDGRTGILVPPKQPAALAGALERLSEDPALRVLLGRSAREKVMAEFNLTTSTALRARLFLGIRPTESLVCKPNLSENIQRSEPVVVEST
jgi:colanic acid/amylovoran biosynthesis glycosyltransferase